MTSRERERRGDRRAVFDRDDHTCRRCGADRDDGATLRCYAVGDVPNEDAIHEDVLVTVCEPCFTSLQNPGPDPSADPVRPDPDDLFTLTRELTQRQGVTVSAVASFASLATSLPGELEDADGAEAESGADEDADAEDVNADAHDSRTDAEDEYVTARREVLLAIDSVPARLDRLAAVDASSLAGDVAEPLANLVDAGAQLQTELQEIVRRCEAVAAGLDRCHGCLEPLAADADRCPTCACPRRRGESDDPWNRADGVVDFTALFNAINDALQDASATTEGLAEDAGAVAGELHGSG